MDVSPQEILDQLTRIESAAGFSRGERLNRFLRYVTEETLAGRSERLKEYTIATDVFGRPSTYDPQVDSLVRVQASLLRTRLRKYYESEGRDEAVHIEIPKGGYGPVFHRVTQPAELKPRRRSLATWTAAALAIAAASVFLLTGARQPGSERDLPPSVTVLPFADLSPGGGQTYLCEGIAEELISALSRIPNLRVVARTSAFQYKGKDSDVRRIGADLHVRTVVEGSVRRQGETLRVTAQLINTADGNHLWSATFDRRPDDLLAVEEEIARAIAASLRTHIQQPLTRGAARSPEAYRHYLAGLYWRGVPTLEHLRKAIGEFSAAVATEPFYAPAQAALAEGYARLYFTETVSAEESAVPARAAAAKALELDSQLATAYEASALVHLIDWDFSGAGREYRRALELDPTDVRAQYAYASLCLTPSARYREAIEQLTKALDLDPVSRNLITELGADYRITGQYARARELFRKSLDLEPGAFGTRTNLAATDVLEGRFAQAVEGLEAVNSEDPGDPWIMGHLGFAYGKAGRGGDARRILAQLTTNSTAAMHIAAVHAGLGEAGQALDWLERGVAARSPSMFWLKSDFRFAALRNHPRYAALLVHYP